MEKWELLIRMVLTHEGGYANVSGDAGGQTYCGIARKANPNWKGWKIIDANMPLKHNQKLNNSELDNLVFDVYKKNYYVPMKIDMIDDLMISAHVFCHGVNAGNKAAIILLQKAINAIYGVNIAVDGIIGATTLQYANRTDRVIDLGKELIQQRNNFYRNIVKNKPFQKKFLNGWLNRVTGTTNTVLKAEQKPVQNVLYADYQVKESDTTNLLTSIGKGIINLFKRKIS